MHTSLGFNRSTGLKLGMLIAAALVFGGAGAAQADYASAVLDDNPIAYYRLGDTGIGTAANEVSGSTVTGTYVYAGTSGGESSSLNFGQTGPATITGGSAVGINQNWVRDTNTDHSYLNVTAGAASWNDDNYTVEMWFKPELDFDESTVQYVFNRNNGSASQIGDGFLIAGDYYPNQYGSTNTTYSGTNSSSQGGLLKDITAGKFVLVSNGTLASSTKGLTEGNWYHAVLTRSGDTLALRLNELLADGTAGWSETIYADQALHSNLEDMSSAVFGIRSTHPASYVFGGDIAEVALYNGALSETQVNAHFNAAIPEPGSLLLLGAGATMMLYRRRTVS